MDPATGKEATGFKGLPSLVSDVSSDLKLGSKAVAAGMASEWPRTVGEDHWATKFLEGKPPQDTSGPMDELGAFLGAILRTRWGFFALIGGLIWTCEAVTSKSSRSSSYSPPASSRVAFPPAPSYPPSGAGSYSSPVTTPPASTPAVTAPRPYVPPAEDLSEMKPPVGEGLSLSTPQVRYCVFENVRIERMQPLIKNNTQVATFNRFVEDYNQRCGRFRYARGTLESVQRQASERDTVLAAEARRRL